MSISISQSQPQSLSRSQSSESINTTHIDVDPDNFDPLILLPAAEALRAGGLVIFPTETVYGLGGDATNAGSAKKIYDAKGRPSDNPLIIHISDPKNAEPYCVTTKLYYKLAASFMPGPLTVIMKKKDTIPSCVTGGLDSVAVRCPAHPVANELIKLAGVPIAAPSANLSGKPSPTKAEHAAKDLDGRVDFIINGGECRFGVESTIVRIDDDESLTLLRPGAITCDALRCVAKNVTVAPAVTEMLAADERPLSPGMKYRHYAPSKPLKLVSGTEADRLRFFRNAQANENCIIICYDEQAPLLSDTDGKVITIGAGYDLETQMHRIFAALRESDEISADVIYANLPDTDGLGLALYNRLIRAAAHTVIDPNMA